MERAGRRDGEKECRYTVSTGNKVEKEKSEEHLRWLKLFYNGAERKGNGIEIVMREELVKSVLEARRVSDRLMAMRMKVKGSILNIVSAYAPQVNNKRWRKKTIFGKTWMG